MSELDLTNNTAASIATPAAGVLAVYSELTSPAMRLSTKDESGVVVNLLGETTTDQGANRVTNKDLDAATTKIVDGTDTTKKIGWQASGAATATTLTLAEAQSTSQTLNIPNITASSIIITDTLAQNITGTKTFGNAGLLINNPAATFTVQVTPSAEVASRVLTIPLLGAADTLMTLGTAQSITGLKTFPAVTTSVPSMTITPAGTVMTTPTAGVIEADAAAFYKTMDITEGRTLDDRYRFFKLAANATPFTAITDYFGANSAAGFVTNAVLQFEWHCYFAIATLSTQVVTWTITNTQTTTNMVASWSAVSALANMATAGASTGAGVVTQTAAVVALPNTGVMVIGNHYHIIRAFVECATAGNIRLRCNTASTATVGPLRDSWFKVRRMSALNTGTFVA